MANNFNFSSKSYWAKRRYINAKLKVLSNQDACNSTTTCTSSASNDNLESDGVNEGEQICHASINSDGVYENPNPSHDETDSLLVDQPDFADTCLDFDDDKTVSAVSDSSHVSSSDSDDYELPPLKEQLHDWIVKNRVTLSASSELLKILQPHHPELPMDMRTLLKSPKNIPVKNIAGGEFHYFGIKPKILSLLENPNINSIHCQDKTVELQVNIDGLPLFKSSNLQLWPILGLPLIREIHFTCATPFVIGLFCGKNKPKSVDEFLYDFVEEAKYLDSEGVSFNGVKWNIKISSFICDTPARAFIKCVKGHTGYSACERCIQSGNFVQRHMTFPETRATLRTGESFRAMIDDDHHMGVSPLCQLNVNMITSFVLDYMHLICLGVTRRIIRLWLSGPLTCRIPSRKVNAISDYLVSLNSYMPHEFARKPRSLKELDRWKATEFRTFLLYCGLPALMRNIDKKVFDNFTCLSVAIFLLSPPVYCQQYCNYAKSLLVFFVEEFSKLYGEENVVYNIHNLVHLSDDVEHYGPLDSISAFVFENYLGQLKRMVRKPQFVIQQLVSHINENDSVAFVVKTVGECRLQREHNSGPNMPDLQMFHCKQYKEVYLPYKYCLKTKSGDNCILVHENVALVRNIVSCGSLVMILFEKFQCYESFFSHPVDSKSINIFLVSSLSGHIESCDISEVKSKMVLLPYDQKYLSFHSYILLANYFEFSSSSCEMY